jgi:hypothetical protein
MWLWVAPDHNPGNRFERFLDEAHHTGEGHESIFRPPFSPEPTPRFATDDVVGQQPLTPSPAPKVEVVVRREGIYHMGSGFFSLTAMFPKQRRCPLMITAPKRPQFLAATTAYARWCTQRRHPYRHPHDEQSSMGWKYVHLRDSHGDLLARYDCETGRILRGSV